MYLAFNAHYGKRTDFIVHRSTFPYIKEVVKTRASMVGINIIEADVNELGLYKNENLCGVLI